MTHSPVIQVRTIHLWRLSCTECGRVSPETAGGLAAAFEVARAEGWECGPESEVALCSAECAETWRRRRSEASFLSRWAARARHATAATS